MRNCSTELKKTVPTVKIQLFDVQYCVDKSFNNFEKLHPIYFVGGVVSLCLMSFTPDQRSVLRQSQTRHLTLTVTLPTQIYK